MHCGWLLTVLVSTLLLVEMMQPAESAALGRGRSHSRGGRRNGSPCPGGIWRNGRCRPSSRGGSTGRGGTNVDPDGDGPVRPGLRPGLGGDDDDEDGPPVRPGTRVSRPRFDDDDDNDRPVRPGSRTRRPSFDDDDEDRPVRPGARVRCHRGKKGCNTKKGNKKVEAVDVNTITTIQQRDSGGMRETNARMQTAGQNAINGLTRVNLEDINTMLDQGDPESAKDVRVRIDNQNPPRLDEATGVRWANVQVQLNGVARGGGRGGARESTTIAQATVPVGVSLHNLRAALTASLQSGNKVSLVPNSR